MRTRQPINRLIAAQNELHYFCIMQPVKRLRGGRRVAVDLHVDNVRPMPFGLVLEPFPLHERIWTREHIWNWAE